MPPLKAIDRPQIALLPLRQAEGVEVGAGGVAVPDFDVLGLQRRGVGVATDEPEELGDDGAEEDAFGGEEGEDGGAGWCGEAVFVLGWEGDCEGAGACSVWAVLAVLQDVADEV